MRFIGYLYIMLGVMQSLSVVGLLTGVPTILAGKHLLDANPHSDFKPAVAVIHYEANIKIIATLMFLNFLFVIFALIFLGLIPFIAVLASAQ